MLTPAFIAHMETCEDAWAVLQDDPDLKNWSTLRQSVKEALKS